MPEGYFKIVGKGDAAKGGEAAAVSLLQSSCCGIVPSRYKKDSCRRNEKDALLRFLNGAKW